MLAKIAHLFLPLSVLGFLLVLAIHISALYGVSYGFEHWMRFVVVGLFVVWLPAVLVMGRLTRDFKQKDLWRAALRGCPKWMIYTSYGLFGYAFFVSFVLSGLYGGGMNSQANTVRSTSAIMLAFYGIASALLYSATRVEKLDATRRCLNGHRVSLSAKYCEECGAPVVSATAGNVS